MKQIEKEHFDKYIHEVWNRIEDVATVIFLRWAISLSWCMAQHLSGLRCRRREAQEVVRRIPGALWHGYTGGRQHNKQEEEIR